jgi:hypothetical protein
MVAAKAFPTVILSAIFIFLMCFRPVHHDVTGTIARYQNKAASLSALQVDEHLEHRPSAYSVLTSSILIINTFVLGQLDNLDAELFFKLTLAIFLLLISLFVTLLLLGRFDAVAFFILLFAMGGESWWVAWQPSHLAAILCVFLFPLLLSQKKMLQAFFFIFIGFVAAIKYVTLALPFSLILLDSYFNKRSLKNTFVYAGLVILSGLLWLKVFDWVYDDFEMILLSFTLNDGLYDWTLKRSFEKLFYFLACTPLLLTCLFILISGFAKNSAWQKILLVAFLGALSTLSIAQANPHLYHNGGFVVLCLVPLLVIRTHGTDFFMEQIPNIVKLLSVSNLVFALTITTLFVEVPYPLETIKSIYPVWVYVLLAGVLAGFYFYTRKHQTHLSGVFLITLLFLLPFANHGSFYHSENTFRTESIKNWDNFWYDEGFGPFQTSFLSFGTAFDNYLVQQKTSCGLAYGTFIQRVTSNTKMKKLKKIEKWNRVYNCYKDTKPTYILMRDRWASKATLKRLDLEHNCSLAKSDGQRSLYKCTNQP